MSKEVVIGLASNAKRKKAVKRAFLSMGEIPFSELKSLGASQALQDV
jgi:hypothetical protein